MSADGDGRPPGRPRSSILGRMAFIALIAVDCAAIREMVSESEEQAGAPPTPSMRASAALLVTLPMVNLLAATATATAAATRPRRPGRAGFLAMGGLGTLVIGAGAGLAPDATFEAVRWLVEAPVTRIDSGIRIESTHRGRASVLVALYGLGLATMMAPAFAIQLPVALLGGWIDARREFRRRPPGDPPTEVAR